MEINSYLNVIAGVIVLLALLENVIPNSNSGKSVKRVVSVACVLIILSPIINIVKGSNENTETAFSYNEYLQEYQNELVEKSVNHLLITEGYNVENLIVTGEYDGSNYTVKKIQIKFKDLVINENSEHINIIEKIDKLLSSRLNISRAEIVIDS